MSRLFNIPRKPSPFAVIDLDRVEDEFASSSSKSGSAKKRKADVEASALAEVPAPKRQALPAASYFPLYITRVNEQEDDISVSRIFLIRDDDDGATYDAIVQALSIHAAATADSSFMNAKEFKLAKKPRMTLSCTSIGYDMVKALSSVGIVFDEDFMGFFVDDDDDKAEKAIKVGALFKSTLVSGKLLPSGKRVQISQDLLPLMFTYHVY